MAKSSRRDELVETARALFYRKGFHATGIDTILSESGVAKMTLYKHFKSKDDLIIAVLQEHDAVWQAWFNSEVERRAKTPKQQLIALFDVLAEWVGRKDFRGCLLINAAAEFGGLDPRVQNVVLELRQHRRNQLERLAVAAKAHDPVRLVSQLSLLLEGTIVLTLIHRNPADAATACATAAALIRAATTRPRRSLKPA